MMSGMISQSVNFDVGASNGLGSEDGDLAAAPHSRAPASFQPANSLVAFARRVLEARTRCAAFFPKDVFRDAAWDMMLEIFIATEEARMLCVKHVVLASRESATGAMRRIEGLEQAKLIKRVADPMDHRRVRVELTSSGYEAMTALLKQLYAVGSPTPADLPASCR